MENSLTLMQEKAISVLQSSLYPGASTESVLMVLDYCKARKLDPFLKPVHIVPMWDSKSKTMRDVVMAGLNLYRTQAAESGQLAGISEPVFGEMEDFNFGGFKMRAPAFCKVTVSRLMPNGSVAIFTAVEFMEEAISVSKEGVPTPMWKKRPRGMLAKTAESQALRKAFPDINSAETAEEMDGKSYFDEQTETRAVTSEIALKALDCAKQGTAAYTDFWKSISAQERKEIRAAYPQGLNEIAKAADAKAQAEIIEEAQ